MGGDEINVKALKGQIDYILNQTDAGKAAGKVDVIVHSTGGLVLKKYVQEHPTDHI
jgi:triacylglycerol esterase/lipase EstA (alpha/beta hydrolase family)